jgi:hypothetical protein
VLAENFGQKANFYIKTKSKGVNCDLKTSFIITKVMWSICSCLINDMHVHKCKNIPQCNLCMGFKFAPNQY